ncbi:MAG: hypothetical protein Q9181_007816, partial [Wetmoreana brouardii]
LFIKSGVQMRLPEHPEIVDVSDLDPKGNVVTDLDPIRMAATKGNCLWHADMAFSPRRGLYSIIRAVELPPSDTGGNTKYADSRTAYEDLPDDIKQDIEGLIANNSLAPNRKLASPEECWSIEPLNYPMARHRLVVPHEGSGRKNLYVTTYLHHFDGQTMEESKPLLDKLLAHVSQEKYVLDVQYEKNGDMVLWDNTAVLHRATSGDSYAGKHRGDMRRTTVKDSGKYAWGECEIGAMLQFGLAAKLRILYDLFRIWLWGWFSRKKI